MFNALEKQYYTEWNEQRKQQVFGLEFQSAFE